MGRWRIDCDLREILRVICIAAVILLTGSITSQAHDVRTRMMTGAKEAAWDATPWNTIPLVTNDVADQKMAYYTFGYTFGYLGEQVTVGVLTAGTTTLAKILIQTDVILIGNLAPRVVAVLAMRSHFIKEALTSLNLMDGELRLAYERMMTSAAREPTTPLIKEIPVNVMESRMANSAFDRNSHNFQKVMKAATKDGNIRKLITKPGGAPIFKQRTAQLTHLLGDECDAVTMKNFMKVVEEKLVLERPGGDIDEWIEDFLRVWKGSPSDFVNRPSLDDLSANGVQRIKTFLGEPYPSYAWKFEEGLETQWKAPIVRGILVELDLWHRIYKPAGWTHLATAEAVDFVKGVQAAQLKSIGTVNSNTITRMKDAISDLVAYGGANAKTDLLLDIRKKSDIITTTLEQELHAHVEMLRDANLIPDGTNININLTPYEFIPKP